MKIAIQHEFDDEPTYIVNTETGDELVTLHPSLDWETRLKIAEKIKEILPGYLS